MSQVLIKNYERNHQRTVHRFAKTGTPITAAASVQPPVSDINNRRCKD